MLEEKLSKPGSSVNWRVVRLRLLRCHLVDALKNAPHNWFITWYAGHSQHYFQNSFSIISPKWFEDCFFFLCTDVTFNFVSLTSYWCGQKPSSMCRTRTVTHHFTRHCVTTHCPNCDSSKICKTSASWSPGNPLRILYAYLLSVSQFKSILLQSSLKYNNKNLLRGIFFRMSLTYNMELDCSSKAIWLANYEKIMLNFIRKTPKRAAS